MSATASIPTHLIQDSIVKAVENVCRTMIKRDVKLRDTAAESTGALRFEMFGSVGFGGQINGIVYLCLSDDFAQFATGEILGMSPGEVEMNGPDVVKDAIGEVTNMTAGGFKNTLCDLGFPCQLSLPTIGRGRNLQIVTIKDATRHVFAFDCSGHGFLADIQLKAE